MLSDIPAPMRSLGLAGLIPFVGLAILVITSDETLRAAALRAQIGYGAVIVSFLGALHWGAAVQTPALANWPRMAWGVTPSLLGWVTLLLPPLPALVLLTAALLAALVFDEFSFGGDTSRAWFVKLRRLLSIGAMLSLVVTLSGVVIKGS
ncbi:conserved membrane protein of unknown function [Bradyrhizobium sp. ORS 285]|uniref:DUF3429 domain-containing protein n=1 Tax=Bradyrhizobium sp. ORS 285 TaxID=115808 RepID=UPI000240A6A7|nr:DUF3429 domain-containing protein [Bradyrhizobium sp. ORS 285]CCD89980.1 conserved membrane hypothetical protein [Bradyrhizobium sp. ORS 285]SMX55691.1 conserved membrane protein of unknown function [Bradyrhizobium sp. ORS 285]